MPFITVGRENSGDIKLYYEDHGAGRPVVLIHGWPLSGAAWEKQVPALLAADCRVIAYDRRGFGHSSQPAFGYDYETFTNDLHTLLTELNLRDVILVGHSMGTGEVARYLGRHGAERVSGAVAVSTLGPHLQGVNPAEIQAALAADRPAFLRSFLETFYNFDVTRGKLVSDQAFQQSWSLGVIASPIGTRACVDAWVTDFRKDVGRIATTNVPFTIVHGDADRVLPFAACAEPLHRALPRSKLVVIEGGSHGIAWTHANLVNGEILAMLRR
jgi:pimeloyl-ACP methyl ester carboxylesterase